jgi:hypothetical protein
MNCGTVYCNDTDTGLDTGASCRVHVQLQCSLMHAELPVARTQFHCLQQPAMTAAILSNGFTAVICCMVQAMRSWAGMLSGSNNSSSRKHDCLVLHICLPEEGLPAEPYVTSVPKTNKTMRFAAL